LGPELGPELERGWVETGRSYESELADLPVTLAARRSVAGSRGAGRPRRHVEERAEHARGKWGRPGRGPVREHALHRGGRACFECRHIDGVLRGPGDSRLHG